MSFTDRFGGSTIQAAQVSLRVVALDANQTLQWPPYADDNNSLARIMQVAALGAGLSLTLPDATESSPGFDFFVNNVGAFEYVVLDAEGTPVATLTPGQSKYIYLVDVSTVGGSWQVTNMGSVPSNIDAGQLAGLGLLAIGATLNQSTKVAAFSGNQTVGSDNRSWLYLWQGAAGTLSLPLTSSLTTDFFVEVRNQGSGVLTLPTTGGETVDGSASIALQVGESCFVHAGVGAWYTVGRGRSVNFAFTQLVKTVTGGTTVLTLTEAANVVQTYNGVLTSSQDIILPPLVQVYYVSNQTSGAFAFNVRTAAVGGAFVSIPSGQNAVLFCDGTNVINASTTVAGISSLVMAAGSAASPSLALGTTDSGLYSASTSEVSVTSAGSKVAGFSASGLALVTGSVSVSVASGSTGYSISRPAGAFGVLSYKTGVNARFDVLVDNVAESGSNAGSNFNIVRYNDAGASLGTALSINRATGAVGVGLLGVTSTNSTSTLTATDTGTSGVNVRMVGNGATTPTKTLRVLNGNFEMVNSAYSSVIMTITDAGQLTMAGNILAFSDRTLKTNIQTVTGALERLMRVRVVTFNMLQSGEPGRGVIAQELLDIYPDLVQEQTDGKLAVNYMGLIGECVAGLQEVAQMLRSAGK